MAGVMIIAENKPDVDLLLLAGVGALLDNLNVVDTSFFPSIDAVDPALTAMANAIRVGDHLLERMGVTPATEAAVHP